MPCKKVIYSMVNSKSNMGIGELVISRPIILRALDHDVHDATPEERHLQVACSLLARAILDAHEGGVDVLQSMAWPRFWDVALKGALALKKWMNGHHEWNDRNELLIRVLLGEENVPEGPGEPPTPSGELVDGAWTVKNGCRRLRNGKWCGGDVELIKKTPGKLIYACKKCGDFKVR